MHFLVFTEQCWQFYPMFSSCECTEHLKTKSEHLLSSGKNTAWKSLCWLAVYALIFKWLLLIWKFADLILVCFLPPAHSFTISCILVVFFFFFNRLESIFPRICRMPTMHPFSLAVVIAEVTAILVLQTLILVQGQSVRGRPVSELKFIWLQSLSFYCTRLFEWICYYRYRPWATC